MIQIEEPLLHFVAASSRDQQYLDFLIDCFNHEISGLEEAEVWIHTCWGNANMQRVLERTSYAEVIETYLERVAGDVWTVEMKDRGFADLELLQPYRHRLKKKIAVGVVSHRTLQVESPEEVANDIRYALNYIEPENLCSRPTADSGGRARTGSWRSTSPRRSSRVRTSCAASSEPTRSRFVQPIRCSRSTRRARAGSRGRHACSASLDDTRAALPGLASLFRQFVDQSAAIPNNEERWRAFLSRRSR